MIKWLVWNGRSSNTYVRQMQGNGVVFGSLDTILTFDTFVEADAAIKETGLDFNGYQAIPFNVKDLRDEHH